MLILPPELLIMQCKFARANEADSRAPRRHRPHAAPNGEFCAALTHYSAEVSSVVLSLTDTGL
jgi:hypothetical protein